MELNEGGPATASRQMHVTFIAPFVKSGVVGVQEQPAGPEPDSDMHGEYTVSGSILQNWSGAWCLYWKATSNPLHLLLQWTIENFSKLDSKEYSPKFEIGTHLW